MNLFLSMSVFVKIVEIGSLNGAAIKLGLSPTMVGKHLKLLVVILISIFRIILKMNMSIVRNLYFYNMA